MSILIVASDTSSPLCTDTAVPHDANPNDWPLWECPYYRKQVGLEPGVGSHGEATCSFGCYDEPACITGGPLPFPFTAARWADVCELEREGVNHSGECTDFMRGAIVALVEIVGPSHHADECRMEWEHEQADYCTANAEPHCWHTPTGTVTPIDPIVCERPMVRVSEKRDPSTGVVIEWLDESASHWSADDETAEKLTKAMT